MFDQIVTVGAMGVGKQGMPDAIEFNSCKKKIQFI